MSATDIIKAPISDEMKKFEPYFQSFMKSKTPLLDIITRYILKTKGKQMRPMLVFLSAKLTGEITESTYNAASFIELMHTATLIHDDVVDESHQRRGFFSINALWKNKIAVLIGDYFLAKGLLLAVEHNEFDLLRIVSEAVREMSEGELLQIEKARKLDITQDVYFQIITKKTATLIAACTASGAKSSGASDEVVEKMKQFGKYLGIAFQIKDDLFDYQPSGIIGKPTGNDIKEKKMTLPLIYVLNNASDKDRRHIMKLISKNNKNTKNVSEIVDFVKANGGLEYTRKKMEEYHSKAFEIVSQFSESDARTSMIEMVNYAINRKK